MSCSDSRGTEPGQQAWGSEFKPQYHHTKKETIQANGNYITEKESNWNWEFN
jgi:hypothetical protein